MDITKPPSSPGTSTQLLPAKELHEQATVNCRIKTVQSVSFIQQEDLEAQVGAQSKPRDISPRDRTVIEFSKFCSSGFYSEPGISSSRLPDELGYTYSYNAVSDFCSVARIFSHSHKSLFNDITDTIRVNSDDEDRTRTTLRKLVHSDQYDNVKGIEVARNAIPIKAREVTHTENSETDFLSCRRSTRIGNCSKSLGIAIMQAA